MAEVEALYPLSPQQEGMLLESLAAPQAGVFVEQLTRQVRGGIDPVSIERAWQTLVDRHTVLRTAFAWRDQPVPIQAVLREVCARVAFHDWNGTPAARVGERLAAYLAADQARGFDLG